jgi:hypothetical protein
VDGSMKNENCAKIGKMKMSVWSHVSIHVVGEGIMDSMQRAAKRS